MFSSLVAGPAAGCRCKVLLSECCLRFGAWLLVAAAGCRCKVLLSECCLRFGASLLVAAAGCRCKMLRAVCALELGCWCRCRVPLQVLFSECCWESASVRFGLAVGYLALRNLACATPRIAQLRLRNFQDCAALLAQLVGLRDSACAIAFDRLRNSRDCATLLVQLRWPDCATLQLHFLQAIPAPIALANDTCPPQEQDVIQIPTPWNFKLTWSVHKVTMISKFSPPWNLKLAWSLHKVKTLSKFPPSWNFKLT